MIRAPSSTRRFRNSLGRPVSRLPETHEHLLDRVRDTLVFEETDETFSCYVSTTSSRTMGSASLVAPTLDDFVMIRVTSIGP